MFLVVAYFQVNQYMNRAEELKQCFKTKSHSNPDELLARYSKEHAELRNALQLASIGEISVSLDNTDLTKQFIQTTSNPIETTSENVK